MSLFPDNIIRTPGDVEWFAQARFGMFIHWGLYALPARHEWVKFFEDMSDEHYQRYFDHFEPDLFDPDYWADLAAAAGMKYFVVTTKHHDGFCLWDSKHTDYKSTNAPLCGRDLITPMVKAFRDRGMRVGLYHSLIDWHHPQYTADPQYSIHHKAANIDEINTTRDQAKYADYLHAQVRELLELYGPDILWLDFSYPNDNEPDKGKGRQHWRSEELVAMVRKLCPKILLDNRLNLDEEQHPDSWDFITPEQSEPRKWPTINGKPVVWETCQTFSGSWGYHREEATWKSVKQIVGMLAGTVSCGGNLLLNVGPTARGQFDFRAIERLTGLADWMRVHGRSIYGCTQAPSEFKAPDNCRLTWNPDKKRLYVHVMDWPLRQVYFDGPEWAKRIEYAQLLSDGSELKWHDASKSVQRNVDFGVWRHEAVIMETPVHQPHGVEVPVIELFIK